MTGPLIKHLEQNKTGGGFGGMLMLFQTTNEGTHQLYAKRRVQGQFYVCHIVRLSVNFPFLQFFFESQIYNK